MSMPRYSGTKRWLYSPVGRRARWVHRKISEQLLRRNDIMILIAGIHGIEKAVHKKAAYGTPLSGY